MSEPNKLTDVIGAGLDILFVGINPSTYSAASGHHFARNTNRFYRALYEGGLTPRLYAADEDGKLLELGIGVTNIAERATGMAQGLKRAEYVAGREPLRAKVRGYRPRIVAFAGRMAAAGFYGSPVRLGVQPEPLEGASVFVVPSPSAANKAHHPDADLYMWYARLREFRDRLLDRPTPKGEHKGERNMALEVGAQAPKVTLVDDSKQVVNLPVPGEVTVLAFFPAAFTGVCTTEMCSFRDAMAQYNSMDAKVFGVSVDPPFTLAEFKKQNGLNFPLLADFNHEAIRAYGVEFPDLAGISGYTVARRSVYVIGKDGKIAWTWLSDAPANEPDYDAVREAVRKATAA